MPQMRMSFVGLVAQRADELDRLRAAADQHRAALQHAGLPPARHQPADQDAQRGEHDEPAEEPARQPDAREILAHLQEEEHQREAAENGRPDAGAAADLGDRPRGSRRSRSR